MIYQTLIPTPLGQMTACATEQGLCMLEFPRPERIHFHMNALQKNLGTSIQPVSDNNYPVFTLLKEQLTAYFDHKLQTFQMPLFLVGTDFQKQAWHALQQIPYGQTRSYAQQAVAVDNPAATRAVAAANGCNRISIVVPCHRVIGSDGSLTGFGGELWRKKALLELEINHPDNQETDFLLE